MSSRSPAYPESAGPSSGGPLISARSRRRRRGARALAVLLILAGVLLLADAITTLVWQEPISALYASLQQAHLKSELRRVEERPPTPTERVALASISDERHRISFLASRMQAETATGAAVGKIVIPSIGASYVMVNGTDAEALQSGPGIYPETHFPGVPGTTAVAGHRTTYLAPFRHIDALKPGSIIKVDMPYAHFTYTVYAQRIVQPENVNAAIAQVGYTRLVLSACTPLFTAEKRLLVYARLTRTVPEGAAKLLPGGLVTRPFDNRPASTAEHRQLKAVLPPADVKRLAPIA